MYNNYIHRFLSVPAIFVALLIIFKEINAAYLTHPLVFASAFAILKAWSYKQNIFCSKFSDLFAPISYGLSFAFLLTFLIVINKETSLYLEIENWYLSSAAILISLLYFENSAIKKLTLIRKNKFYILVYLFTILLTIATLKSPGIMAAFLIMLISFNYRNIFMLSFSVIFLFIYIIFFYYDLEINLLMKSQILISTGILFLIIKYLIQKLQFNSEKTV